MLDLVAPKFTSMGLEKECCIAHVPVAPRTVAVLLLKGATGEVTTECSAPVLTIKVSLVPYFYYDCGLVGDESERAQSLSI